MISLRLLIVTVGATACVGSIGGPGGSGHSGGGGPDNHGGNGGSGGGSGPSACGGGPIALSPSPLRRLTRTEYDNTVRDLLGDASRPAAAMLPDEVVHGFAANSSAPVARLQVEQYGTAAEGLARRTKDALPRLLGCDPAKVGEDSCARSFIATFGRRAFRRPLIPDEVNALFALYQGKKASSTFAEATGLVVEALLNAPSFLYRVEIGSPATERSDGRLLDGWEMASRLAYFLWSTMPDDVLLDAAQGSRLSAPVNVGNQAARMVADARFGDTVASFHRQWLGLATFDRLVKDNAVYPQFTPEVRAAALAETMGFVNSVVRGNGDGRLETLLTAPYSLVTAPLAPLYGLATPAGSNPARVELDSTQRAGVATQISVLATRAAEQQSSPIRRGVFVRESLLCQDLAPPPGNVNNAPPKPDPSLTTRERYALHRQDPVCAACHGLIDPPGFAFENYDGIGRFRSVENGKPIDASAVVTGTRDADGSYVGAVALLKALARSQEVRACFATQWFRFALGRADTPEDRCTLAAIDRTFAASGGRIKDLVAAITTSDAFRFNGSAP